MVTFANRFRRADPEHRRAADFAEHIACSLETLMVGLHGTIPADCAEQIEKVCGAMEAAEELRRLAKEWRGEG
jgi:hypothetical protein